MSLAICLVPTFVSLFTSASLRNSLIIFVVVAIPSAAIYAFSIVTSHKLVPGWIVQSANYYSKGDFVRSEGILELVKRFNRDPQFTGLSIDDFRDIR